MLTTTSILLDKTPSLLDLKYPSRIPRWKNLTTPSTTLSPCPSSPSHSKHASFLDSKEKKKECQLILHTLQVWRKQWQVHYTSWRQGITADVLGQYKCILHALKAWRTCTFLLKNEKLAIQLDHVRLSQWTLKQWHSRYHAWHLYQHQLNTARTFYFHHLLHVTWYTWLIVERQHKKNMFYTNVAFTWWQRHLKRNGLLHWYHRLSLQIQWNHVSKVWKQNWDQWKLTFYLNAWYQWTYKLKNHLIPSFHQCALRHQTYLLQRTFHHWHQQGTYLTNTLLIFSSHVYQRSLLRSHLKQWSQQYLLGVAMQPTLHALQTYYLTHLLQRVWKAWHSLPAWTDPADKCYLHAWFRRWHHAWSSRTTFLPPFTLRRQHQCFHGWYARTLAIRQARLQGQLVYHFRSLHLQSWTFQGWLHQVHQSQRYWTWVQWAEQHHYQRHLKHRVFKVWVHTTQDQLRNHFRLVLYVTKKNTDRLLTFWKTWWTYCLSQRLKRKSFQCALLHFHRHVLQKTFHDWFQWTLWHQWMQSTQLKADHFYGQQRLQWGWSIWKHRAHFKKTIHQRTQVASCWYLRQLVRRGWTVWILKLRLHLNLLRFYHHLHQRQIHEWFLHSWNVWRYRWQQNIKSYQIWYHQFMKWVIAIWIVSHSKAIQEKKKLKLAKDFFEKQLCETNFCAWVVHTKCRKLHLIHSTQAEKWYQFKKFATVFNFWKKQHHQLILYRTQVSNANQFYKFQLLRSYFYEWYEKRPDWHFLYQFNIIRPKVYFKSTQLRRAFIAWRQHIQSQKQSTWRSQFAKIWKQGGRGVVNQDPILSLSHHQSDPLFSSSSPSTDPSLSTNIRNTVGTVNFIQNPSNRTAGLFSTLNENKVNSLTTTTTTTTSNPILNTGKKRLKPRPLMRLPI